MTNPIPKIFFYIPSPKLIDSVPSTIKEYWEWVAAFIKDNPVPLPEGGLCDYSGPYTWTVQTYIYLKNYGFSCELTPLFPDAGIILTHSDFLPVFLKPSAKQFIVEIKPDRYLKCIYSNFVIVQNRRDPVHNGIKRFLIKSAFVNNWPQPGLIPRNSERVDRFENICFMGNPEQFIDRIDVLESEVKKLGLNWITVPREKWHDYSEADAIVAVRPDSSGMLDRKPATRLTNAWLAGVPAILSPDIAFEDIRMTEVDYLRARNIPEIVENLKRLINEPSLRSKIAENGKKRSSEFDSSRIIRLWVEIIEKQIKPEYFRWNNSYLKRAFLFSNRILAHKVTGIDPGIPLRQLLFQKIIRLWKYSRDFVFKQKCIPWRIKSLLKHGVLTKNAGWMESFIQKSVINFYWFRFLLARKLGERESWRIGFLTDEFEHPELMPFGGYGMTLKFVTDYFNNHAGPFTADVLMCSDENISGIRVKRYHSADLVFVPKKKGTNLLCHCSRLLQQRGINVFIGVDHFGVYEYYLRNFPYIPWVVWIKDPKDGEVWNRIASIPLEIKSWGASNLKELLAGAEKEAESLRAMINLSRAHNRKVYFAAESPHLAEIARRQYKLDNINAFHWPKPIPLPVIQTASFSPEPSFLFLARLDPIKRPWIYFELAKRFKNANFYVAGISHNPKIMEPILAEYRDVPNLKFLGRVVGNEKASLLNRVWAVVNTSIHEGVPVSLLEGFSYGKPAIAALNPDGLTSRFGIYVGEINGEGNNTESVDRFSQAVERIINNKYDKEAIGGQAREYISRYHSYEYFSSTLQRVLEGSSNYEYGA